MFDAKRSRWRRWVRAVAAFAVGALVVVGVGVAAHAPRASAAIGTERVNGVGGCSPEMVFATNNTPILWGGPASSDFDGMILAQSRTWNLGWSVSDQMDLCNFAMGAAILRQLRGMSPGSSGMTDTEMRSWLEPILGAVRAIQGETKPTDMSGVINGLADVANKTQGLADGTAAGLRGLQSSVSAIAGKSGDGPGTLAAVNGLQGMVANSCKQAPGSGDQWTWLGLPWTPSAPVGGTDCAGVGSLLKDLGRKLGEALHGQGNDQRTGVDKISDLIGQARDAVKGVASGISGAVDQAVKAVKDAGQGILSGLQGLGDRIVQGVQGASQAVQDEIRRAAGGLIEAIKNSRGGDGGKGGDGGQGGQGGQGGKGGDGGSVIIGGGDVPGGLQGAAPGDGKAMPRLQRWVDAMGGVRDALAISGGAECGGGPTINLPGAVSWRPLSWCGGEVGWGSVRTILAAMVIIAALWLGVRMLLASISLDVPGGGDR